MPETYKDNPQIDRYLGNRIRYHPKGGSQTMFHCQEPEVLLAGPAGTGKSLSILHKLHLVLSKYKGSRAFMSRKTRTSMTNSCLLTFQQHVLKPPDKVHFHKQDQQFTYPNGSMLAVIGLDDPERIKSTDWDLGFIQEATECTENDIEIATTRLRNWVVPYQQLLMDCNPDRPTHWLKKRCDREQTLLITSSHKDNPRLWNDHGNDWSPEGMQYLAKLDRLTGARRARLFLGQWAAAEGLVYDQWDPNIHLLNYSDLPQGWDDWPEYWTIDFGYQHPFVWQQWKEDDKGRLYMIREIYMTKRLVEDHAAQIMEITHGRKPPQAILCDHDAEGRATFERHTGLITLPAYKSISEGINATKRRLRPEYDDKPGLFLLRDSLVEEDKELKTAGKPLKTEDEWDGYVWDKSRNENVNSKKDELPVDRDNHGMDSTRYMVAFADSLAEDPADEEVLLTLDEGISISPL